MTALIIIGAIILLFAFLLHATVNAEIKYYGGKLDFKVTYLFLTLFPLKIKEKKEKKGKRKKDISAENTENIQTETVTEASAEEKTEPEELDGETKELLSGGEKKKKASSEDRLSDIKKKLEQFKIIWGFCKKPLIKLFGGVYIDDLVVDFKICGEDACQAAMNYGKVSAVFYNALNVVRTMFPMSVRTVDIVCDFDGRKSAYDGECAVRLRLGTAVGAALVVLLGYIKNMNDINNVGAAEVDSDKEKVKVKA
ncbi:MAG: hypothetical protein ACI4JF_09720 [Oscillospiraceae bacterium]